MRRLLALPAVLAASLAWAAPAFGHAAYVGSDPAPGERLEAAPARVVLVFTEPLNGRLARATLRPAAGGAAVAAPPGVGGDPRQPPLPPPPGGPAGAPPGHRPTGPPRGGPPPA